MVDAPVSESAPRSLLGDDLAGLVSRYRRYFPIVLGITVAATILGIGVSFVLKPRYTAEAIVQYAPEKAVLASSMPQQDQAAGAPDAQDQAIDTQVAALTSPDLALRVETTLGLDKDPEFAGGVAKLKFTPDETAYRRAQDVRDFVAARLVKKLKVKRVGQALLISVDFTSLSSVKAARIANAFAQAYLDQQLAVKIQQGQTTSTQINGQLESLRHAVQDADAAVQRYKIANNLMNVSSTTDAASQTTIVQQEVIALNDQLALARADAAGAQARFKSAQAQLKRGGNGETVGAAIESPVIAELRRQYAEASRHVADLETTYGPSYPDLVAAKSEVADLEHQIHQQVDRILSSLQSEADVAQQRLTSIESSLESARGQMAAGNVASVQLADLQRTADAAKAQYESFLNSANAISGQSIVARADSQISTPAGVPLKPSFPNPLLFGAVGFVLGAFLGAAVAFVIDQWSGSCATMEDVERNLGLAYAGALPTVASSINKPSKSNPIDAAVAHPLSSFAESFRNLAAFLLYSPSGKPISVLAVTSALPKEGKTATSICLARVMALSGTRVVLLDCDLRRRSATEALAPQSTAGLIEVLDGKATLEEALVLDESSGAYFLPLTNRAHLAKAPLASKAMDDLLARLRREFQLVVLDTAPVLAVVDTRALAKKVDSLVMLIAWRSTPSKAVRAAVHLITSVGGVVTGGALTMVNLKAQSQSGYGDPSYYYRNIKGYYAS